MSDFGHRADPGFGVADPFADLPEDPEEAFLKLEEHFRAECDAQLRQAANNDQRTDIIHVDYMAQVVGAINALGLADEFQSEVPSIENVDYNTYLNFNKDVVHYRTTLRIRRSQREQGFSVQFDETAKRKIRHHLDQVLAIFGKLEVDETKRAKLISRLNDLQNEINHRRTRFDRLAALSMEVAGVVGDVADRSKLIEILDSVARVFWGSQTEKQKQLPPPTRPKSIAPPKPKPSDMDDDIPF